MDSHRAVPSLAGTGTPETSASRAALHIFYTLAAHQTIEIRVGYEHSLASAPEEFIVHVPSQVIADVPVNVPRALLPEFITNLIAERSPSMGANKVSTYALQST